MAMASILTGKTQVVLRQADLSKCVKMAEGNPQEAFMHLQKVFFLRKPEKCPELFTLCMSFEASVGGTAESRRESKLVKFLHFF